MNVFGRWRWCCVWVIPGAGAVCTRSLELVPRIGDSRYTCHELDHGSRRCVLVSTQVRASMYSMTGASAVYAEVTAGVDAVLRLDEPLHLAVGYRYTDGLFRDALGEVLLPDVVSAA